MLGVSKVIWKYVDEYYIVMVWGVVFVVFGLVLNNILCIEGLVLELMKVLMIGMIINIVLNLIFIFIFGLGVVGLVLVIVIFNVIGDFLMIYYLCIKF